MVNSIYTNVTSTAIPSKPITGQTWVDTVTRRLKIFDGTNWSEIGKIPMDWIENLGHDKANALLQQLADDEKIRESVPMAQEAWEQYQTLLKLGYSELNK